MSKHFSNNHRPNMATALQKAGIDPAGYSSAVRSLRGLRTDRQWLHLSGEIG